MKNLRVWVVGLLAAFTVYLAYAGSVSINGYRVFRAPVNDSTAVSGTVLYMGTNGVTYFSTISVGTNAGNWAPLGTTNSQLAGQAFLNSLTATGEVAAATVTAGGVSVRDGSILNAGTVVAARMPQFTGGNVTSSGAGSAALNMATNVLQQKIWLRTGTTNNGVFDNLTIWPGSNISIAVTNGTGNTNVDLVITGTGSGSGDVVGQASSVDSEVALFSGTGGKTIKRATGTGIPNITSGVFGTPYTTTGSGTVVPLATSPVFTTPNIGAATATSVAASGALSGASLAVSGNATVSGSITIGAIEFGTTLAVDDTYAGITRAGFNNSGGVTQWDAVYLNSSSQWVLADANGSGTYPAQGIAVATVATGNATTVITRGTIRNDAWNWTIGGLIYLSATAGGLTQTAPGAIGDKIQVMGYALNADTMAVQISMVYVTVGDTYFEWAIGDNTTAITTGTAKESWRAPFAFTVKDIRASLITASSSGIPTVDINEGGTTIISTKLTIDASETTSTTAATPYVISDASIADDALITFDIDVAGTGAAGLKVKIYYTKP